MNREKRYKIIARKIDFVDSVMSEHFDDYGEETHRALKEAVEIISALSAEGEYIKKEDALAELNKWDWQELYLPIHFKENILDVLPTYSFPDREKGEDRPKGHWIESGYVGNDNYLFECSECHHTDTQSKAVKVNYCWHCGADMRGKADE